VDDGRFVFLVRIGHRVHPSPWHQVQP
jgi:hypothetical protein